MRRRVLAQQPVEQQLLQRRRAVALDDEVGGVGHRDRAHQAELGLHEEIGDAVLHQRMRRLAHAQHAGAMAHGVHAELLEGDLLHLAIGRVVVDPVLVAAEAVARLQHRRMLVGDLRQLVEPVAGQRAQPIEMRRHLPRAGRAPCRATAGPGTAGRSRRSSGHGCRARCGGRRAPCRVMSGMVSSSLFPAVRQHALDIGRHGQRGGAVDVLMEQRLVVGRLEVELDGVGAWLRRRTCSTKPAAG